MMSWKNTVLDSERFNYSYFSLECVCRLCWGTEGVVELTSYSPKSVEKDATIAEKLLECVGIDVNAHTQPNKICISCLEELEIFTEFKKFCKDSDRKLHDILQQDSSRNSLHSFKVEIEDSFIEPTILEEEINYELKLLKQEGKLDQLILKSELVDEVLDYELNDSDLLTDDLLVHNDTPYEIGGKVEESSIKRNKVLNLKKRKQFQIPIYCFICHIKFDSNVELAEHNLECHGKDKNEFYKCYGCEKRYRSAYVRLNHEVEACEALNKGYQCKICHRYLLKRKTLLLHMRAHRENKTLTFDNFIKCKHCSELFETLEGLRQHNSTHKKNAGFICEVCGRVFKSRGNLNIHKVVHTGQRLYKCPHCDHTSAQASSLSVHIRIHTGVRPYACDMCPQRCHTSSNLKKHKKCHLGIKDYKCKVCGKQFGDNYGLKEHMAAVHERSKIHACSICDSKYYRFRTLREHLLVKHGQKVKKVKDGVVPVATGISYKRKKKEVRTNE